jgi:hypothetical protein
VEVPLYQCDEQSRKVRLTIASHITAKLVSPQALIFSLLLLLHSAFMN